MTCVIVSICFDLNSPFSVPLNTTRPVNSVGHVCFMAEGCCFQGTDQFFEALIFVIGCTEK